ncbi:helix-turn-helix domain-containing protein [Shouchella sp. JSM 1781072]|uniref:helix-turn-helix domain-containing protein n=1 Tax=Bacillaceae TaxID=186817 RepID=UPI000C06D976|nr:MULTISPECIES: XRE family transcriptional regulator [Bacillaceae]UTR08056.1 XRE family transcriptional regulator [Alkalihalobacillus sp. LMS6]
MRQSIGLEIKKIRKQKKFTLKQLAEKTSLSISFLSQIERGKSSMTLESLNKISDALNISASQFFSKNEYDDRPIKKQNIVKNTSDFFHYQSLVGGMAEPIFEPRIVTLLPTKESITPFIHEGQEFIFVLEGTLTFVYKDTVYELHEGDSFHFESTEAHNWINYSDETVKLLQVVAKKALN